MENNLDNLNEVTQEEVFEHNKKAIEKKKSIFRLFWLFVCIDVALLIWIVFLIIKIFCDAFSAV